MRSARPTGSRSVLWSSSREAASPTTCRASWTLRADLSSAYVCRLLNHMDRHGYRECLPRLDDAAADPRPLLPLNSGYVQRGIDQFPKQGPKSPWVLRQNYILDKLLLQFGAVDDGTMVFSKGDRVPVANATPLHCGPDAQPATASA